jgi:serine/threonine protein kinase/tetratricopeptide (TPR) repeat protein
MVGATVSNYKILERLGGGGMGIVYKAQDLRLNRSVALKFLPPDLTRDARAKQRFIQEAQTASALDHPNICTIHEVGETPEGQLFISMACYEGETLKQRIGRAPLSPGEVIDLARQIAKGLAKAHEKGIVHRDINPANIMVTADGMVKILDFGLAKLAGSARFTQSGTTVGTIPYMSPEQVSGENLDHRSDIWSFGVVVYEMLTGRLPFRGDHAPAVIYSIMNEAPLTLDAIRSDVPAELVSIVARCLEKNRDARAASMAEILKLLGPTGETAAFRPRRGHRRTWNYVSIAGVVFVGGAVALWALLPLFEKAPRITTGRVNLAILRFSNPPGDTLTSQWPPLIQSMLEDHLLGTDNLGVLPWGTLETIQQSGLGRLASQGRSPYSIFNEQADATLILTGSIVPTKSGYRIHADLVDAVQGVLRFSTEGEATRDRDLEIVVPLLATRVRDHLLVEEMPANPDTALQPWYKRRSRSVEAQKAFLEASTYLYRGEAGADELLRRALELDSTFISPRVWLISGLLARGKRDEALKHQRVLEGLEPAANGFEKALIRWCRKYLERDLMGQIQAMNAALEYSHHNSILLVNLSDAYYQNGDYRSALDAILPVYRVQWHFPDLNANVARCYAKLAQYDDARRILDEALANPPVDWETHSFLSALLMHQGDSTESDRQTHLAQKRFNEKERRLERLYHTLGSDFFDLGAYSRAADYFRRALQVDPTSSRDHVGLGDALFELQRSNEAAQEYQTALRTDSTWWRAHLMLATIATLKGDRSIAAEHFASYLRLQPTGRIADTVRQHRNRVRQ